MNGVFQEHHELTGHVNEVDQLNPLLVVLAQAEQSSQLITHEGGTHRK